MQQFNTPFTSRGLGAFSKGLKCQGLESTDIFKLPKVAPLVTPLSPYREPLSSATGVPISATGRAIEEAVSARCAHTSMGKWGPGE